jgi:MtN3 and saliva related transmembrane protein
MELSQALGSSAAAFGCVMATAPLLQARLIVLRGSSDDLSKGFLALFTAGSAIWAAYALSVQDWFVFVPNVVATATCAFTLTVANRVRRRANCAADHRHSPTHGRQGDR